jgi:hypothetical protein
MNLSSIEKLLEQIINQLNKTSNEIHQDSPPHFRSTLIVIVFYRHF